MLYVRGMEIIDGAGAKHLPPVTERQLRERIVDR